MTWSLPLQFSSLERMMEATFDTANDDLGVGLQLPLGRFLCVTGPLPRAPRERSLQELRFYNTQIFLIAFSLLGLSIAYLFLHVLTPGRERALGQRSKAVNLFSFVFGKP